jgi:hypothetical protein
MPLLIELHRRVCRQAYRPTADDIRAGPPVYWRCPRCRPQVAPENRDRSLAPHLDCHIPRDPHGKPTSVRAPHVGDLSAPLSPSVRTAAARGVSAPLCRRGRGFVCLVAPRLALATRGVMMHASPTPHTPPAANPKVAMG